MNKNVLNVLDLCSQGPIFLNVLTDVKIYNKILSTKKIYYMPNKQRILRPD